ncbi:MAG: LuxR C-terminal-related transcriptional regulator [Bacteroidetes bacterium]|jgi:DNA-binding NarL/FixJ family response regulator|nr:LuxR C-terminal-related transcriptional regulator [Bacteroidota bacterium]
MQYQVIICDKQNLYAMGCSLLIKENPLLKGYHFIESLEALHKYVIQDKSKQALPLLLVIDSSMFDFNHAQTSLQIADLKNRMGVMVVFNEQDDAHLYQLVDNGISVIVSRHVSQQEWSKALEMARLNKIYFCNVIAEKVFALVNHMDKIKMTEKVHQLHTYDKYILVRICEEASSKQIAYEVGHSKRTIEGHRTKMMQKLEVKNLAGLVKVALMSKLYDHYLVNPGLYDVTACAKTSSL